MLINGQPVVDPTRDVVTTFMFSGDPVQDRGYIDRNFPGDRYFYLSSGPFTLAPGDSQEVVAAKVIAIGSDRLDSTTQAVKIATFDVVDEIIDVWDLVRDEASGEDLLRPVQTAFDTGLQRYLLIDQDRLRH